MLTYRQASKALSVLTQEDARTLAKSGNPAMRHVAGIVADFATPITQHYPSAIDQMANSVLYYATAEDVLRACGRSIPDAE